MTNLRVFVYSGAAPQFDHQAGDRRFLELLRILARSHIVDFCAQQNETDRSNPSRASGNEKYRRCLTDCGVQLVPHGWRHIERALLRKTYDVGIFEFYYHAAEILPLFRRLQPQARVLTDSVDIHFARERAAAELDLIPLNQVKVNRERELAAYRASDIIITVTDWDRASLEMEDQMPPVAVVPLIIPSRSRSVGQRKNELLFVGGFQHLPNLDGLQWFIDNIWQRILEVIPDTTLIIVGSNPTPKVRAMADLPGVQVLGHVQDVNLYLDSAAVSIAPLRFGAGMKGKVVDAMASGVPVVTTTIGVQGLQVVSGRDLLIADEPAGFAAAVISVLNHPDNAKRIGLAGQHYVAQVCGPEIVARLVEETLASAMARPRNAGARPNRILARARFEALRLICLPYWGPKFLFRHYLKAPLRTLRDSVLRLR